MKNKLLYLVLSLVVCFSFIEKVFADDLDFTVSTSIAGENDTVVKGENVTINVNVKSDSHVAACSFQINSDSGVDYVSANAASGYNLQSGSDGKKTVDGDVTDDFGNAITTPTNMTLLQLTYKVNNDGKVTIKTNDCSSTDNKTGSYKDIVVELKVVERTVDTTLSKLSVTGGVLSPNFSSDKKNYSIKLSSNKFSLDLTTSVPEFQDNIVVTDGKGKTLDYKNITFSNFNNQGYMPVNITVNKSTVYSLLAVYEEPKLNNSLKSLKVDGNIINIENGKYDYTVKIGSNTKSVKIEASLMDSENFKFIDEFNGTQIIQTSTNSTSYPIIIEPSKSTVGGRGVTYTIKLVKEESSGNDSTNNNNNNQNVNKNPATGEISMFVMMVVLIASLIGSIFIYKKNVESYK